MLSVQFAFAEIVAAMTATMRWDLA